MTEKIERKYDDHSEQRRSPYDWDIPGEIIAGIILKEVMTASIPDSLAIADKILNGNDHSTGIGAIFPQTALDAWNEVDPYRLIPTDKLSMMKKLTFDDKFSIESIAVVLTFFSMEIYGKEVDIKGLNMEQWKKVVGRYNAASPDLQEEYSNKVYDYLDDLEELLD